MIFALLTPEILDAFSVKDDEYLFNEKIYEIKKQKTLL